MEADAKTEGSLGVWRWAQGGGAASRICSTARAPRWIPAPRSRLPSCSRLRILHSPCFVLRSAFFVFQGRARCAKREPREHRHGDPAAACTARRGPPSSPAACGPPALWSSVAATDLRNCRRHRGVCEATCPANAVRGLP